MNTLVSAALVIVLGAVSQFFCGLGSGYESRYPWLDLKSANGAQQCRNMEQARRQREETARQFQRQYQQQHQPRLYGTQPKRLTP